uniref:Uncharacterized protein n=1 Tax=Heterosigma akashiwo TaxID=2829 RepID=A0A7S3UNI9_HETAK
MMAKKCVWRQHFIQWAVAICLILGYGEAFCLPEGDSAYSVAQGDEVYVCLRIGNPNWNDSSSYHQLAFKVEVDEFSRIELTDSWQNALASVDPLLAAYGETGEIAISIGYMESFSYQKLYRKDSNTFPLFQIVFVLDEGVVEGVTWDDGCLYCSGSSCTENTYEYDGSLYTSADLPGKDCYLADASCVDSATDEVLDFCQLEVYLAWAGTDQDGRNLRSAERRLSAFRGGSVGSYVDRVKSSSSSVSQSLSSL